MSAMAGELEGRVAVVTAAASGMGREGALLFAKEGAHVVAIDINAEAGDALVDEIASAGGKAEFHKVDMTDLGQIADVVGTVDAAHGRIDVLWNHVGAPGPRGFDFEERDWRRSVDLNLTAPIFLSKAAWPLLQKANGASVLYTASISAMIASRNSPIYAALKAGVVGFMRCMAAIGGPDKIRANAIAPGATDTPMLVGFFGDAGESQEVIDERLTSFNQAVPLGRTCKPEEVAALALFLASDRSSYITGVAIPIDGGYVAL